MNSLLAKNDVTVITNVADISALWGLLRQSALQPQVWLDLARAYAHAELPWQAGYAARQTVRLDSSLRVHVEALGIQDWQNADKGDVFLESPYLSGALDLAERFFEKLNLASGDWLTWLYLARLLEMPLTTPKTHYSLDRGLPTHAYALSEAILLEPIQGESLHSLGVWRLNAGDADGAVKALSALLDIRPIRFGSMMYLGEALLRVGNHLASQRAFARAALSNNPDFLRLLAERMYVHNFWQEAIAILKKALTLRPESVPIWLVLARIQSEVYALADCRESLSQLQKLEPDNHEALMISAGMQGRMGDAKEHLSELLQHYQSKGDPASRLASSIAMVLLYQDDLEPEAVYEWHRKLVEPIEFAIAKNRDFKKLKVAKRRLKPKRRLKIGYVTGDLHRHHPVNLFMLPVLLWHDHEDFEIFVYHTGIVHDEYTAKAKSFVDRWLEAARLDDFALHKAIVADEIDILVDLAGHTSSHRLGVFAMRAAPVQATFLGYPHSTGLWGMDWLIGDTTVTPEHHAHLYSEGLAQLKGSVFCWAPVDEYPLPSNRPSTAPLVFGSFNNVMKLTHKTIAIWSQILNQVPEASLLLKAPSLADEAVRNRYRDLFATHGIAAERLIMRGASELGQMMQEYGDVDIALDPMPYNGGTTTMQALWMGVPVVTMAGGNFVSRMGASFMKMLGKEDLVADDEAGYVAIAVAQARDYQAIRQQRAILRNQMASSPLCDIESYVKDMEGLYRRMWKQYCLGDEPHLISAGGLHT